MTAAALTMSTTVGDAERPIVIAAARQLSAAIERATGGAWPVELVLSDPEGAEGSGSIWIASLIDDVARDETIETTTRRWLDRIARWSQRGTPRILLSTLFRNVAPADGAPSDPGRTSVERIRRLNMMALFLSRTAGIEIVDIDRLFARFGARTLGTDYRCLGEPAAVLGGHAIAAAIFAGGLDDVLSAQVQEQAVRQHGGADDVAARLTGWMPSR